MKCPSCGCSLLLVKDNGKNGNAPKSAPSADTSDVGELLDAINDDALTGAAVNFVAQTRERYAKYKDRILLSETQMKWLRDLAEEPF